MKKILKNKKGFTLIELLAVIVVLAIIMVIATQQVNGTIKKSRGNAFYETVQSLRKSMQTVCASDNKVTAMTIADATTATDVSISVKTDIDSYGTITVTANEEGKFTNVTFPSIDTHVYSKESVKEMEPSISFKAECPVEVGSWDFDKATEVSTTNNKD